MGGRGEGGLILGQICVTLSKIGPTSYQGCSAGHFKDSSVVTGIELVTDIRVLVVEDAVGPGALGIDAGLRFLLELSGLAVDVVGQDALLTVTDCVVEQKAVRAEVGLGYIVLADVVQVTLFRIGKKSVLFWN